MLILRPTKEPLVPTRGPADWQAYLTDPEKHWKDGRSAKMLAEAWEGALPELPPDVRRALAGTAFESFRPHLAVPEYCVELPGGGRASQNDLYVLGRIGRDLAVMMVEGKVDESFGPLLEEWLRDASDGKRQRLAFLESTLGIETELPGRIRYQLLHRAASPVIEAMRVGARYVAMVVHSFSAADAWLEDYRAFARLMGVEGAKGRLERVPRDVGVELWMGWVGGGPGVGGRWQPRLRLGTRRPLLVRNSCAVLDVASNPTVLTPSAASRIPRSRSVGRGLGLRGFRGRPSRRS